MGFGDILVSKTCHFFRVSCKGWGGGGGGVVKSGILRYWIV